jgi:hypothetical protein
MTDDEILTAEDMAEILAPIKAITNLLCEEK